MQKAGFLTTRLICFLNVISSPESQKNPVCTQQVAFQPKSSVFDQVITVNGTTVKFLNFRMPENFAVIYLKIQTKRPNLWVFRQKDANGKANSEDPDQTAPLGAV